MTRTFNRSRASATAVAVALSLTLGSLVAAAPAMADDAVIETPSASETLAPETPTEPSTEAPAEDVAELPAEDAEQPAEDAAEPDASLVVPAADAEPAAEDPSSGAQPAAPAGRPGSDIQSLSETLLAPGTVRITKPWYELFPRVGATLTASTSGWGAKDVYFQWFRDDAPLAEPSTDAQRYVITSADEDATISVSVYGVKPANGKLTETVWDSISVPLQHITAYDVTIADGASRVEVGQTLSIETGTWAPESVRLSVVWFRGLKAIATGNDYVTTENDLGRTISAVVTGSAPIPALPVVKVTNRVSVIPVISTGTVSIATDVRAGDVLEAAVDGFAAGDDEITYSYSWARVQGEVADEITGATGPTYTVQAADRGWTVVVLVTASSPDHASVSVLSAPTSLVPGVRNTVAAQSLTAGDGVDVTGGDFAPNEEVAVWLHSTPVLLGTLVANSAGVVTGHFAIPANTPAGVHHIVLVDAAGNEVLSGDITVAAAAVPAALASTGVDLGIGWLALAVIALGGAALAVSRRRAPVVVTH